MSGRRECEVRSIEPQTAMAKWWRSGLRSSTSTILTSQRCIGKYTFHNNSGKKSTIDHVLVNDRLLEGFKGMFIDEEKGTVEHQ